LGKQKITQKKNLGLNLLPIQKFGLICHFKKKMWRKQWVGLYAFELLQHNLLVAKYFDFDITLANSTQIILFSEMFQIKKYCEG
jgi:hypothetical protein